MIDKLKNLARAVRVENAKYVLEHGPAALEKIRKSNESELTKVREMVERLIEAGQRIMHCRKLNWGGETSEIHKAIMAFHDLIDEYEEQK